ncbi:uracil-DNA glycosylase [Dethiobacter alkaliphilus]|uniref:Uracil-DNA glycosylase-like domain-containing protein n=1 Tax=Dethiobacter alkaliphilus AHT 1 TaxID=555088 RepID=C0GCY3_DETAL|nr:uracil-DNA glycosylase [Dethiobacter alkaliphilus]EEG79068.1 conserved hypothetical protein [Dethiobacter alkaliphilus AHT 1]
MSEINKFIQALQNHKPLECVCNPWRDYHHEYDIGEEAPALRAAHLQHYLHLRVPQARFILVAEALGYQGGRFSGIAMTSERILLNNHQHVQPAAVFDPQHFRRTSSKDSKHLSATQKKLGFNEPTATVVWGEIRDNNISPSDVILWNIFPFHPHKAGQPLTNRTPKEAEKEEGLVYVKMLQQLCPKAEIIAIGNQSHQTLQKYGIENKKVPHPSMGGVTRFRQAFKELVQQ